MAQPISVLGIDIAKRVLHVVGIDDAGQVGLRTVDHSTINRWAAKYSPELEAAFHHRNRLVWLSWRMDKTYIKFKGRWYYLYRAVDKAGQ